VQHYGSESAKQDYMMYDAYLVGSNRIVYSTVIKPTRHGRPTTTRCRLETDESVRVTIMCRKRFI